MSLSKLSKYAFYAFVFLLPFQTVLLLREPMIGGAKWQYGVIGIYGTDILLVLAIVSVVIARPPWRAWQSRKKNCELRIANSGGGEVCHPDPFILELMVERRSGGISLSMPEIPRLAVSLARNAARIAAGGLGMTEKMLLLLLLWAGLSMLWAPDAMLAGYFFVKLLLGAGVFFITRSLGEREVRTVVRILIAAAVIQSLLGIWQLVTQSTFASTLLGMSHYEVWQAGTSVLKNDTGRWLRAYGSFPHPNILGGFLSAVLVMMIAGYGSRMTARSVIASAQGARGNPRKNVVMENAGLPRARGLTLAMTKGVRRWNLLSCITNHLSLISYLLSCILILLGLILTFSRTAWLGTAMGIAFLLSFACSSQGRSLISRTVLDSILVLVVATVLFVGVFHEVVFPRFDGGTIDREGSVEDRVQSLRDAEPLIAAHLFLGVGAGNFTAAVMKGEEMGVSGEKGAQEITGKTGEGEEKGKMGAKGEMGERGRPVWTIQPAHNVFVLVLTELGAVGLLLFVGFLFSVVMRGMKIYDLRFTIDDKKSQSSFLQSEIFNRKSAILLALLPSLFLDHWLWSSHFGMLFFFLISGLVVRYDFNLTENHFPDKKSE